MLLFLITGGYSEISRMFFAFLGLSSTIWPPRITNYILLPLFIVILLDYGLKKVKFYFRPNFIIVLFILLGPLLLTFVYEFYLQTFTSVNNSFSFMVIRRSFFVLVFLFFSNILIEHKYPNQWLKTLLKPYVVFCLFTSISGIFVFILIMLNIIHVENWPIPNFFRIGGDFASGKEDGYYMPLWITLVEKNFFGLGGPSLQSNIYRYSGLSHEPNVYAMFTISSLFFLPYVFQEWSFRKKSLAIGAILLHLLLTISITFYMVITVIALIIILR